MMQQRMFLLLICLSFGSLRAALNWEELLRPETDISFPEKVKFGEKMYIPLQGHMPLQDITPQRSKEIGSEEKDLTFLHRAILSEDIKQVTRVLDAYKFLSSSDQDIKWNAKTSHGRTALQMAQACKNYEIYVAVLAWRLKVTLDIIKAMWFYNEQEEKSRLDIEQQYGDILRSMAVDKKVEVLDIQVTLAEKREKEIQKYTKLFEEAPVGLFKKLYRAHLEMILQAQKLK